MNDEERIAELEKEIKQCREVLQMWLLRTKSSGIRFELERTSNYRRIIIYR